ncbi:hypothetical protein ACFVVX_32465 [Kitasatospora sp. NPDC058170]|uniref:hypothetical protein n=1 Tax=Kitasatospora sp. NPDC058170 TaxID=3346364 RepID=UPI0036D7F022
MSVIITSARTKTVGAIAVAVLLAAVGGCAGSSSSSAAAGATGTATAGAGAAPAATGSTGPAEVGGSARIAYAYSPDDDIRFTFEVVAEPFSRPLPEAPQGLPTDARGTVRISHHVAALNRTVTSEAAVDCLVTGDRTASFTAVITRADEEVADSVGQRRGFSVLDGGSPEHPDRVGFSWGVANLDIDANGKAVEGRVGTCMAPAPFAPVVTGDLTVRPADLPPIPTPPTTPAAAPTTTPVG